MAQGFSPWHVTGRDGRDWCAAPPRGRRGSCMVGSGQPPPGSPAAQVFRGNAAGAVPGAVPDRCSTPRLRWGQVRHPACNRPVPPNLTSGGADYCEQDEDREEGFQAWTSPQRPRQRPPPRPTWRPELIGAASDAGNQAIWSVTALPWPGTTG